MELGWLVFLVWIYDWLQDLAPLRRRLALADARSLLSFETTLGLDPERTLDHWLAHEQALGFVVSNFYAIAIFAITFGFAAWLWWRRPELYVPLRNCIVLANLMAFAVFWAYPVAPPRMLSGFVDVVAHSGALGWHNDLVKHADQLAAMPSMHMGYAVWCALVAWQAARTRRTKILAVVFGVSYSLLTTWAVIATGNHYLLDVVAGTATTAVAALIVGAAPLLARACRRYVEALLGRPAPARLAQRNVVARTRERLPAQRGARGYTPPPRQGQPPAVSTATSDLKAERAESLG